MSNDFLRVPAPSCIIGIISLNDKQNQKGQSYSNTLIDCPQWSDTMTETQQQLEQLLATVQHDDSILTFLNPPARGLLMPASVMLLFLKTGEELLGFRGAKILMYRVGFTAAYGIADKVRQTAGVDLDQAFQAYVHNLRLRGWGSIRIIDYSFATGQATIELTHSLFAEGYPNKGDTVCA